MAATRLNLTKAAIDASCRPEGRVTTTIRRRRAWSSASRRRASSFLVYRWVNGRPERITLGRYARTVGRPYHRAGAQGRSRRHLAIAKGENPLRRTRSAARSPWAVCSRTTWPATPRSTTGARTARSNYRLYLSQGKSEALISARQTSRRYTRSWPRTGARSRPISP